MMGVSDGREAGENKRRKSMELSGRLWELFTKLLKQKETRSQKSGPLRRLREKMQAEETTHPATQDSSSHI